MIDPKIAALFARPTPTLAISEYHREQLAILANRDRLKTERLARDAGRR
jgi:hypothetical protein